MRKFIYNISNQIDYLKSKNRHIDNNAISKYLNYLLHKTLFNYIIINNDYKDYGLDKHIFNNTYENKLLEDSLYPIAADVSSKCKFKTGEVRIDVDVKNSNLEIGVVNV